MRDYELNGLMELGLTKKDIKPWRAKTGIQYRIKVRNNTGRLVYITDLRSQRAQEQVAKYYKIPMKRLKTHISPDYKRPMNHDIKKDKHSTMHIYTGLTENEFWDKLENVVLHQEHALKFDVAIGYTLVNRHDPFDTRRFHPGTHNTSVFKNAPVPGPQSINTRKDVIANMEQLRSIVLEQTIDRPNSSYMLKSIDEFFLKLFERTHKLGSEEAVIPEVIRLNKHVINFPQPPQSTKCLFYCIAYHLTEGEKNPRHRMSAPTKAVIKKWLAYKGESFTDKTFPSMYKRLPPVDIYQLSDVEDCFKINIEVYGFDEVTQTYNRVIDSTKSYDSTMTILSHNNHAMYITNPERFAGKHGCPKCSMVFATPKQLHKHKQNKCEEAYIKRFVKEPYLFRPATNKMSRLLSKYGVKGVDPYTDHYMVYDFEAILKPLDADKAAKRLTFTSAHIPVSVSIHDSLTNETKCFVNDSPKDLLVDMFTHAETKRKLIVEYNTKKYSKLLEKIRARLKDADAMEPSKMKTAICKRLSKDEEDVSHSCGTIPLVGFNSNRYDLNIIKDELFVAILQVSGCERITRRGRKTNAEKKPELGVKAILSGSGYMCLDAGGFKMLDISKYVAAGTSLRQYLKAYLGKCQCADKIKCTCQMSKGHFPYEYLTSFDKLEDPLPPRSAFNSSLRSTSIGDKEWKRVQWVWQHYGMKTLRDLLIWYNDLDVIPFSQAIRKQMMFFRDFGLDMFADGVSLPGLAEKIMYSTVYEMKDDKSYIKPRPRTPGTPFMFNKKRFNDYKQQDEKVERTFDMTLEHVNSLLKKQRYLCGLCYEPLTQDTASVDRIINHRGHENDNIHMTCSSCNTARKDMDIAAFRRQKLLEYNANRLIHSIDEDQSEVYNMMERNIVGGPSIIFNRFAKTDMTRIRGGKLCKKVIGYDANALYLWCLGQDMPCGRLTKIDPYTGLLDDILADKEFGFVECDIATPEHLKEYFEEMTPIFKNIEIDPTAEVIGDFMAAEAKKHSKKKSRKLIGSYFGEKILIYTPLLKWYIAHGMVVSKVHSFVKCHAARPFHKFTEMVSDARREGDVDKSKAVIADSMKLVGNSPYGRSAMNQTKHKSVVYESCDDEVSKLIENNLFQGLEELNGVYEVTQRKRTIFLKNPIHVAIAVYQLAKLRMLAFYFDCIDKYIDRSDFQYQEMDTDSGYIAFSAEHPFPDLVKPELREDFEAYKYEWFPRDDTPENAAYDKRTPGLFKEEWRGNAMVSLSSKNYICYDGDLIKANWFNKKTGKEEPLYHKTKCSAKGVQKSNNKDILTPDKFEEVINEKITLQATNRGFRVVKQTNFFDEQRMSNAPQMQTYQQEKNACGFYYDKRIVLEDGITTVPLNI